MVVWARPNAVALKKYKGRWMLLRYGSLRKVEQRRCGMKGISPIIVGTHQFSSVQLLSCVRLFVTQWTAACQASLSIINSWSLLKLMSIESVMPSNHLILCHPLLLPPSISPSIRIFSDESALRIRWPKYWSFSFNISPSNNTQDWSPLGWTGWISLQSKGLSRVFSNTAVQKHQFSALSFLHSPTLTSILDHSKNHSLDRSLLAK